MNASDQKQPVEVFPFLLTAALLILIDGLALLVVTPFQAAGLIVFENPDDPFNLVYFFFTLLLFTAAILLISKFLKKLVQGVILGAVGLLSIYVLFPLLATLVSELWSLGLSIAAATVLVVTLARYPEWYVIDICCIIIGVGTIAMLGISLSILLVVLLLIGMSVYDAISVYKTKHMIGLANTVLELKSPIMLIIPKTRNYSLLGETRRLEETTKEGEERNAFGIGLGDIVLPGILVVSTFSNITSNGLLVASSVMLGTLVGLIALLASVAKGNIRPGLPYLCSGAILGYLVSSYLLFGQLVGLTSTI